MAINQLRHRDNRERRLYTWVAVLIPILVLVGFAPNYYLSTAFGGRKLSVLVHLHGVVMTSWIVLFIVQVRLVAAHRVRLHFRLGVFGVFFIACIAYDTLKNHKLHQTFALGALLIIVSQPLRLMLSGTEVWMQFASWLVR